MNYCSILINDIKIGLKFGMASFRYLSEGKLVEGKSINKGEINEIGIAHIIYSGYFNNCLIKDQEPEYSFEWFVDNIEMNLNNASFMEGVKNALEVWSKNEFISKATEATEEPKKKAGKKLKPSALAN
jgi:hypothetical protein